MGQCGCGDLNIEKAFRLPGGKVIAYEVYRGCSDCHSGPGVAIYAYPNHRSEWLRDIRIEDLRPCENGGNGGFGISIGLFRVEDLQAEARELWKEAKIGKASANYATLSDWLEDFGLELIQGAMRRFRSRVHSTDLAQKTEDSKNAL